MRITMLTAAVLPLVWITPAAAFTAGSGAAVASADMEAQTLEIEAYVDEAPEDARIVADLEVAAPGEKPRRLKVVRWRQPGVESAFDLETTMSQGPIELKGEKADRILGAETGSRVAGTFEAFGHHYLLVRTLEDVQSN